jgi:hypothetical protein
VNPNPDTEEAAMAMFPIVVVKERRSTVGAEQTAGGTLTVQIVWHDKITGFQHLELITHLEDVIRDDALVQGTRVRAVDRTFQIELGDEDIPSEYDL